MRDFQVKKGVMGYIVTIGCQVAGFTTKEDLLKAITEYVNDPEATEKKYYKPTTLQEVDHRQYGVTNTERSTTPENAFSTSTGLAWIGSDQAREK
jgi:hypothetical protein